MARKHPCRACKKRQKGCIWKRSANVCLLCTKLKIECIPAEDSDDDEDILPREYIPKALEYWHHQITQLESELQQTEHDLICYRDQQENSEWELSIENGQLKLHTAIRTFEELMMFNQASIRYLSPFKSIFRTTPFRFENRALLTITQSVCRIFSQVMSQQSYKAQLLYSSPKSMPFTVPQIRALMHELIQLHLQHSNRKIPFLHAPTFLQHYNSLADPFSCPITLAVCVYTACTSRNMQTSYSAVERRQLGEFFYQKCKALLIDMFDDPTRKLETIFTITFLNHFITFVLLQPLEARRLITIAYLLCKELEPGFSQMAEPTVLSILFQRHYFYIQRMVRLVDLVIDGSSTPVPFPTIRTLEKIADEDEMTCMYIDLYNHLLGFFRTPRVETVITSCGQPATDISLETILQSDRAIREWYDALPPQFRLCQDFYAEDAEAAVMKNKSQAASVVFAFVHYNMLRVHVCLIDPKPLSSDEVVQDSKDVIQMLSEKAISKVLRSCDLLLSAILHMIRNLEQDLPPLTFELIARVIHGMATIAGCPNAEVPTDLQRKFLECAQAINALMPADNKIPPSLSPLKRYMETREQGDLMIYFSFPMPNAVLILDLFSMFCVDLQTHFGRNQMGPNPSLNTSLINAVLCADYPLKSEINKS